VARLSLRFSLCVVLCSVAAANARARVVVNELYYDHPGADAGHEFVELINDGPLPADIAGMTLEFHNGVGTGWTAIWRAEPGRVIAAGGLFLIGGDLVSPPPDAVSPLSLQNGPDAIRIVDAAGTALDVVGYGGLDDDAYVESRAARAVTAGQSLARAADGVDTDDNGADFVAAFPTPARRNVARHDVALTLASGTPSRSGRDGPGSERLGLLVVNLGVEPVPAGAVEVSGRDSSSAGVSTFGGEPNPSAIAPGASTATFARVVLDPGYHWLWIRARYGPDERAANDAVVLVRRASRIPLLVSEVWSSPRDGCPQFVEMMNAGDVPVDLAGFSLRDTRSRPVRLAVDAFILEPGAVVAATPDPAGLLACAPSAPPSRVVGVAGTWPTFNRSGGAVADSVVVLDPLGIAVDAVAYPAIGGALAGHSLERVDLFIGKGPAVWRVSSSSGGCSPAIANATSLYDAPRLGGVDASPNPFAPHEGELLRLAMHPGPPVARVVAHVYDLDGRRVAELGAAAAFPTLMVWDGRDVTGRIVPPGIYVVACEALRSDGTRASVEKVVVGCAARAR
jgi:Lamin Tail Domain